MCRSDIRLWALGFGLGPERHFRYARGRSHETTSRDWKKRPAFNRFLEAKSPEPREGLSDSHENWKRGAAVPLPARLSGLK